MKKVIALPIICLISIAVFSQTYKLETVFTDKTAENTSDKIYLSHLKILESPTDAQQNTFSLWGYQLYFNNKDHGTYEVEYFKGNAKETFQFLSQVAEFTKKYENEENVLTNILNVQVKTSRYYGFKQTLVYDKERKVVAKFSLKKWTDMAAQFVSYCEAQKINYK